MEFEGVAADKAERQAALVEALTATPEADTRARARLEQLLDPETVAELDERVLAIVEEEIDEEPDVDAITAARNADATRRSALVDALLGRRRVGAERTSGSLDGGARKTPSIPETHGETLIRILRDRSADVGRGF